MESISSELWSVRATAWELAALSFRHPTRELAEAVASGEWFAAAREICDAFGAELPEDFAEGVAPREGNDAVSVDALFHTLRAEATRLFVGPGEPACSPYEGVWRAKADGVKPLLFVNPHSMEVERFVKACGFTHPEGSNDPLDHIATECELLEALALRAAQDGPGAGDAGLPGGSPAAAYAEFLDEHFGVWAADFCNACEEETREPFYRAAAQYLLRIVAS